MDIFFKLLQRILNYNYGKKQTSLYEQNQSDEQVLSDYQSAVDSEVKDHLVREFKSTTTPVQGAVDYGEIKWESYTRAVETAEQFTFYSGPNIAKIIEKKPIESRQQLMALRRVVRRQVADCKLLDD